MNFPSMAAAERQHRSCRQSEQHEASAVVPGHAYAYFIDEQGRTGLVDLLAPAQPELVHAFDTTDMDGTDLDSLGVDFGGNGQLGGPL
jgi:hypothetical protein